MNATPNSKVQSCHLTRLAFLYVRQSSLTQVLHNTESTQRQYALKERALALGWELERIVVIDDDLGRSGASADHREGFQTLITEVSMGRAGIVMGLEVSRLARNNADWHRLLEICALTGTLILDEDGVYDPAHFNDRLLLGLKGAMSEAELHVLRARLIGGILNKAQRGELRIPLPIGLVYDAADRVVLDPDAQIHQTVALLFETFERTGSACQTVKHFRANRLHFPRCCRAGPHKGETLWGDLTHSRALWILHNPRYAGAFCYGRSRQRKHPEKRCERLPREEWIALIPEAHPGYITWERFEHNQQRLRENATAQGTERRRSPPREGPALLQGLAICGRCGTRMTVRYSVRNDQLLPVYVCQREGIERSEPICQHIVGAGIDAAMSALAVEAVSPKALEVTLAVQQELETRLHEADAVRQKVVERARYEVDLARQRFMRVDPSNRLVADALEADWNAKLRTLEQAHDEYTRQSTADRAGLDEQTQARILALSNDFGKLWRDPAVPDRERKRMLRLLIEDVTLTKGKELSVNVRFRGGATRSLTLPLPLTSAQLRKTSPALIDAIDQLLEDHTDSQIAAIVNKRGLHSGEGKPLHRLMVRRLRLTYGLKSRHDRLREKGYLTIDEITERLGVCRDTVHTWRRSGRLTAAAYSDRGDYLFEPPGLDAPSKYKRKCGHSPQNTHSHDERSVV
ncbi:MAG: recombinase family protein [Gammaproteobacteria bacterium]